VIVDRRSRASRLGDILWQHWDERPGALVRWLAVKTAAVTGRTVARRVAARERPAHSPFILSVGNLRVGGTGKTPVVVSLAQTLARRGHQGAILTRGYGSSQAGPVVVRADDPYAADEARLMKAALPEWPVVQARDRAAGLALLSTGSPDPELVILEDGFQTARVGRHLDVVILDRWRLEADHVVPEGGWVLPWGPYREEASGAARAAIWLVEWDEHRQESRRESSLTGREFAVRWRGRGAAGPVPVVPFRRRLSWPADEAFAAQPPYGIVSGLARPEPFEQACVRQLRRDPELIVRFADHCPYTPHDVRWLQDTGRQAGVTAWVTSGKDWVKLQADWPVELPVAVPQLEIVWPVEKTLPDLVEERLSKR
jgi:tetraacyldisaccharide 4'-kinase